jgi:hypothetical protein
MAVSHFDRQSESVVERDLWEAVIRAHLAYQSAPLEEREAAGIKLLRAVSQLSRFLNSEPGD